MGRNGGNLKHDIMESLDNMRCFGESKHEAKLKAKEEYLTKHGDLKGWNPVSVPGVIRHNIPQKTLEERNLYVI